jgi:hypothetical protein
VNILNTEVRGSRHRGGRFHVASMGPPDSSSCCREAKPASLGDRQTADGCQFAILASATVAFLSSRRIAMLTYACELFILLTMAICSAARVTSSPFEMR